LDGLVCHLIQLDDTGLICTTGSRMIQEVSVDGTGSGQAFVNAQMIENGENAPTSSGTQQLTVKLPDSTNCTGGSDKNRCLVRFKTSAGFGNCVVVTQSGTSTTGQTSTSTNGKAPTNPQNSNQATTPQNGDQTSKTPQNSDQKTGTQSNKPSQKKRTIRKRRL